MFKRIIGSIILCLLLVGSGCGITYSILYYTTPKNEELIEENKHYQEEIKNYIKIINDNENQILLLNEQIKNISSQNEEYLNQINSLNGNIESLNQQITNLENTNQENQQTITQLNSQISSLQQELDDLQSDNQSNLEKIENLNNTITSLKETISQLENNNQVNEEVISNLTNENGKLNKKIEELIYEMQNNNLEIAPLLNQINKLETTISYYENYILSFVQEGQVLVKFEFAGSIYDIQIVDKGSIVSVEDPAITDTAKFNYWTVNDEKIELSSYPINENLTIVADVTYGYKVSFMVDAEVYDAQIVEENQFAEVPENPTKLGYTFKGWSINGVDIVSNIDTIAVNSEVTYIAIWERINLVKFMDGDIELSTQEVQNGDYLVVPEIPVKDDYKFLGWSLDGENVVDISNYEVYQDLVFVALWEYDWNGTYTGRAPSTYDVTVNVKNNEVVSVVYRGTTREVEKLENGKYRTVSGISDASGSYTYIHFTLEFTSTDGRIDVEYKRSKSSNYDYQGASVYGDFYVNKI